MVVGFRQCNDVCNLQSTINNQRQNKYLGIALAFDGISVDDITLSVLKNHKMNFLSKYFHKFSYQYLTRDSLYYMYLNKVFHENPQLSKLVFNHIFQVSPNYFLYLSNMMFPFTSNVYNPNTGTTTLEPHPNIHLSMLKSHTLN